MSVFDFLIDFSLASILILIGQLLRAKIQFCQKYFLPASMLAGFLGLALGSQGLNILPFSKAAGSYTGVLIMLIFTIVGVNGFKLVSGSGAKEEVSRIVSYQLYRFVVFFIQFAVPIAVVLTVVKAVVPNINPGFGILLASGFTGGHGTAAAVGKNFADLGWTEATDLGMTFATIGILVGVFGGLAFIKWATKKGYTGYIKDFAYISGDLRTGLVSPKNRKPIGDDTISSVSLDTLCYHFAIVTAVAGLGFLLNQKVLAVYVLKGIPDFTVAYLLGILVFIFLGKTPVYDYVDTRINQKISGTCTDYLVFFGIATIKITIIIKYALPLAIMTLTGLILVFITMVPLGYLMNKESWFERSIFCYGYCTGVFAIGFILLRIVDPENQSKTIEDVALTPLGGFLEIVFWSMIPAMLLAGKGWLVVGVVTAITILTIIVAIVGKMWYTTPLKDRRIINAVNQ